MKCCGSARHSSMIPASTDHCCRTFCCGGHAPSSTTYGTRSTRSPALADTGIKAIWYSVPSNFRDWLSCFLLVKYGNAVKNTLMTFQMRNGRSVCLSVSVGFLEGIVLIGDWSLVVALRHWEMPNGIISRAPRCNGRATHLPWLMLHQLHDWIVRMNCTLICVNCSVVSFADNGHAM